MQLQEINTLLKNDYRPSVAIGHVKLIVSDVSQATDFFLKLGLRYIHQSDNNAVLELNSLLKII
jgi:catechol-2,3-dioxygenase